MVFKTCRNIFLKDQKSAINFHILEKFGLFYLKYCSLLVFIQFQMKFGSCAQRVLEKGIDVRKLLVSHCTILFYCIIFSARKVVQEQTYYYINASKMYYFHVTGSSMIVLKSIKKFCCVA